MTKLNNTNELKVNNKYLFIANDCCISIKFIAVLTDVKILDKNYVNYAKFDNGVEISSTFIYNFYIPE